LQTGLTIGSIGGSKNNNITFRDCHMHKTGKGIYMKFRGNGGVVSNVVRNGRGVFPPFPCEKRSLAKTGSGQTQ